MEISTHCFSIGNAIWSPNCYKTSLNTLSGIHVWRIHIPKLLSDLSHFYALLNPAEKEASSRIHADADRYRFIMARGATRMLLGAYTRQKPETIQLLPGKNKKPFLQNRNRFNLHYNLSHSGKWILIAFGEGEIGVDIEEIKQNFNYTDLLPTCLTMEERQFVNESSEPLQNFFSLWTRKEALLKATGLGITDELNYISCLEGENKVKGTIIESDKEWIIKTFEVSQDYIASIACCSNNPVSFFEFIY
jgi:4'-phosphopantetheinyl transferase